MLTVTGEGSLWALMVWVDSTFRFWVKSVLCEIGEFPQGDNGEIFNFMSETSFKRTRLKEVQRGFKKS